MLKEFVGNLRAMIGLGIVASVNDTGAAQTATVTTATGAQRADVEIAQPFGFSSNPPPGGATCVVIALGADAGNLIALPMGNPYARFGGLAAGEAVIYASDGTRVLVRPGVVEVWGAEIQIKGNVTVTGNLTTTGTLSDSHGSLDRLRGNYNAHVHGTSPPTNLPDPE